MKNYVQKGETITLPAPANVLSGGVVIAGSLIGVANGNAASGTDFDLSIKGVFELPKVSALAIAIGDLVYWDATNSLVTKTVGSNKKLGIATSAAANPSASVNVLLVPVL